MATWTAPLYFTFIRAGAAYGMAYADGEFTEKQNIAQAERFLREMGGNVGIRPLDEQAPNFLMVVGEPIIFGKK